MTKLLLLQSGIFGGQPLERFPALLSLLYLGGMIFVAALLLLFVLTTRRRKSAFAAEADADLPDEVRKRVGSRSANNAIWIFRGAFTILAFVVLGFHTYWALYAAQKDPHFAKLSERDIRVRRVSASNLRGWILDRNGDLNDAFAFWRIEKKTDDKGKTGEKLAREYPLEKEMAHLLGTERGSPGLERTLFQRKDDPTPEALDVVMNPKPPVDDKDVKITIDRDLQKYAYEQLDAQEKLGKHGAIVALNPQTGDVYAIASTPTFNLSDARDLDKYRDLEANQKDHPLVSRATREFYTPGSTFKTFTMIAAFRAGRQDQIFTSTAGGYEPSRGSRTIHDANGGCEAPYGCAPLQISQAFEASSNQYFAQMAVDLERRRLSETARLLGINPADDADDALKSPFLADIWNASNDNIKAALAPRQSAMVTGKKISLYDVALQGMGQGYAGEMTPLQMALVAATAGNLDGNLMKPKIEIDRAPEVYSKVLTPQQSQQIRQIMGLVVDGSGGTAHVVRRILGEGLPVGGKTGTAEKEVPVYDAKTGKVKTVTKKRRDKNGNLVDYQQTVLQSRTDSWFISLAPLDNPQIAIAVIIEGGGFGAKTAAPINANMINKARELGIFGENYRRAAKTKAAPKGAPPPVAPQDERPD